MSIVIPNASEIFQITRILSQSLTIKLFSNDITPDANTVLGDLDETSGGGYVSQALDSNLFTITSVSGIAVGLYDEFIEWNFTGPVAGGDIYGYYVVNISNELQWVERFPVSVVPFTPVINSLAEIKPRFTLKQAA